MRKARLDLAGAFAPDSPLLAVCPHCWDVNRGTHHLCGRCGADMSLLLQESGGMRGTAAIQSPIPVRARGRLTPLQRLVVLCFVVLLFAVQIISAIYASAWRMVPATAVPRSIPSTATGLD